MSLTPEQVKAQKEQLERKALFVPCLTKEHLHAWIKRYLSIDLPNVIVCDDDVTNPPSNSTPMDLVWELYQKAMAGNDPHFQNVLAYAARDSFKTLSASIIEILCLFHLNRSVAHMAAQENQAAKAASYVAKYLRRPVMSPFVKGNNKREIIILRYESDDGQILTEEEWKALPLSERLKYEDHSNYMKIVIGTVAGANSEHVPMLVLDELDLADKDAIQEAKMIPAPGPNGELPITFMTSTRKFSIGRVQDEIDKAATDPQYHLQIRHWNLIDVTQKCAPAIHLPEEPKIPIYYNEDTLKAIAEEEWDLLSREEKGRYQVAEGYAGCLRNCSLFAACRGRLATKQTSTSKLLKPISHTANVFKSVSVERAKAQLLCWKPSKEGLIYPNFSRDRHMLRPAEMYEKITGEKLRPSEIRNFNKAHLIELMKARGMDFHTGMDWGYTHNWAAVTGARDGHRFFIIDVIAVPGLETMQKVDMAKERLAHMNPTVYADPEDPASIKTFSRNGFRMKKFKKDVLGGIEAVRAKLLPGVGKEPELFILAGDDNCNILATRMERYHWVISTVGESQLPTDVPSDEEDDECDALRYVIQNLYGVRGKLAASVGHYDPSFPAPDQAVPRSTPIVMDPMSPDYGKPLQATVDNWMKQKILEATGEDPNSQGVFFFKKGTFMGDV